MQTSFVKKTEHKKEYLLSRGQKEWFENGVKRTAIWTLNYLIYSRLHQIIKSTCGPNAIDEQGAIFVLALLVLLSTLIESDQGKDVYILFLIALFAILKYFIEI